MATAEEPWEDAGDTTKMTMSGMSRKEKRKAVKKMRRKQCRREIALKEIEEEEARLNDAEEQMRRLRLEQEEAERMERERRFLEELEAKKKREEEEEEERRMRCEESQSKSIGEVADGLDGKEYDHAVSAAPTFNHIPQKGLLVFFMANYYGILKNILEFNNSLLSNEAQKKLAITESETSRLGAIVNILKGVSYYHSSSFSDVDIDLLLRLLNSWPLSMVFPVIDILRMIVLHPDGATKLARHINAGNVALLEMIKKATSSPVIPANALPSLRTVNNLFKYSCFHQWLSCHRSEILDAFSGCRTSSNKYVQLNYSTLVLKLIEKRDEEGQSQVLSAALEIAGDENSDTDSKFRALVAIGSLMLEGVVKKIALDLDIESIAKTAKASKVRRIAEVGADIEVLTKQA